MLILNPNNFSKKHFSGKQRRQKEVLGEVTVNVFVGEETRYDDKVIPVKKAKPVVFYFYTVCGFVTFQFFRFSISVILSADFIFSIASCKPS